MWSKIEVKEFCFAKQPGVIRTSGPEPQIFTFSQTWLQLRIRDLSHMHEVVD